MTISRARGVTTHLSTLRASVERHPYAAVLSDETPFQQPVHDGLALTVVYVMLMAIFLQPLLRREWARLASEVR